LDGRPWILISVMNSVQLTRFQHNG
jgi:hypothetical protein